MSICRLFSLSFFYCLFYILIIIILHFFILWPFLFLYLAVFFAFYFFFHLSYFLFLLFYFLFLPLLRQVSFVLAYTVFSFFVYTFFTFFVYAFFDNTFFSCFSPPILSLLVLLDNGIGENYDIVKYLLSISLTAILIFRLGGSEGLDVRLVAWDAGMI